MTKRLMAGRVGTDHPLRAGIYGIAFSVRHDDAGRPVLEFYPATAARFTPDRDLVRITMAEERAFTNPSVVEIAKKLLTIVATITSPMRNRRMETPNCNCRSC